MKDIFTNPLINMNYILKFSHVKGGKKKKRKRGSTLVAQDCEYSSPIGVKYAAASHAILLE